MSRVTMDAKETGGYIGRSYWTILQLVKQKKIPHFKVGNRILFRKDAIDQWMKDQEAASMQLIEITRPYGQLRKITS